MKSELKPIRSEADYERSLAEVERLWGARSGTPEGDRLDVLATLIDAYEAEHPMIGTRTRVAEILNRKRGLSISMIRRLHARLGISAAVVIRPSLSKRSRTPATKR
jgi:HTH-type transcriptional regulator/antitoxin HigA